MAQPVYTQADCAFYNDGTESGSTLISGSNIIVGNTGAEAKGFDTTILFRAVIQLADKTEANNFDLLVSKNGGAYDTRANISGITAINSSNLTQGDDTTQRLGVGANFVSNNNGVGDDGVTTALTTYTLNYEWEVLFAFEVDEANVNDADYFDFRVYRDGGSTALDTYSETLRITVDKVSVIDGTLSSTLDNLTSSATAEVDIDGTLTGTLDNLTSSGSAEVLVDGTLSKTFDNITVSAAGSVSSSSGIIAELDFEEGNLTDWDGTTGGVSATTNAGMVGTYGMEVDADAAGGFDYGNIAISISTNYLGFRFYFDPNSLNYTDGTYLRIIEIDTNGAGGVNQFGYVLIANNSGNYQLRVQMAQDGGGLNSTGLVTITDEPHYIYVLYTRATNSTSADGAMSWKIDGAAQTGLSGIDNYDAFGGIDDFIAGALYRPSNDMNGIFYIDDIIIRDDDTEIGVADTGISGSLSETLGNLTSSAAGTVDIDGSLTSTISALTVSGSGAVLVDGALTETLDNITLDASGVGLQESTGSLSKTLDNLTLSGSGEVLADGQLDTSIDEITVSSAGEVLVDGTLAETLDNITLSGAGIVGTGFTGNLTQTLGAIVSSASAEVLVSGSADNSFDAFGLDASGAVLVDGTLSASLDNITVSGSAALYLSGQLTSTLDDITVAGSAQVDIDGILAQTLDAISITAAGQVIDTNAVIGSLSTSIGEITLTANAVGAVSAYLAITDGTVYELAISESDIYKIAIADSRIYELILSESRLYTAAFDESNIYELVISEAVA